MTGLACLFGLHATQLARVVEHRDGRMVVVGIIRCERCGIRIAEEVEPCTCAELLAAGAESGPCPVHGWWGE